MKNLFYHALKAAVFFVALLLCSNSTQATIKLYVLANDAPHVYAYDNNDNKLTVSTYTGSGSYSPDYITSATAWPGVHATAFKPWSDGNNVYIAFLDVDEANIIINTGNGNQAPDIHLTSGTYYYYYDGNVDVRDITPPAAVATYLPSTHFVYFVNDYDWTNLCAYIYDGDGNENNAWPGHAMTCVGQTNQGKDIYVLDEHDLGFDPTNIIFNNGNHGAQTANLTFIGAGYYNPSGKLADIILPIDAAHFPCEAVRTALSPHSFEGTLSWIYMKNAAFGINIGTQWNGPGYVYEYSFGHYDSWSTYNEDNVWFTVDQNQYATDNQLSLEGLGYLSFLRNIWISDQYESSTDLSSFDFSVFKRLKYLSISSSTLTSFDAGVLPYLKDLYLYNNRLTEINVTDNAKLERLEVQNNLLTSLDVSENPELAILAVNYSSRDEENSSDLFQGLTTLDVSNNQKLVYLDCRKNALTSLNLSNNPRLGFLDCGENDIASLDLTSNTMLQVVRCNNYDYPEEITDLYSAYLPRKLTTLTTISPTSIKELELEYQGLTSLDLAKFPQLDILNVNHNKLTSLNVEECHDIAEIQCAFNQITSLDISDCDSLQALNCSRNKIPALDLQGKKKLIGLSCEGNQLTSLDFSDCNKLTSLDCSGNNISTATGLANLQNLQYVDISDNNLTGALDVSNNDFLHELFAHKNQFTSLKLGNSSLRYIVCYDNNLSSIDFGSINANDGDFEIVCYNNPNLKTLNIPATMKPNVRTLDCSNCGLTSLDVAGMTNLRDFACGDNNLETLNVSSNTKLENLSCNNTGISELSLANNTKLEDLSCDDNNLTSLDFTGLTRMSSLTCKNNKLTEILGLNSSSEWMIIMADNNELTTLTPLGVYISCANNKLAGIDLSNMMGELYGTPMFYYEIYSLGYENEDGLASMHYGWTRAGRSSGWGRGGGWVSYVNNQNQYEVEYNPVEYSSWEYMIHSAFGCPSPAYNITNDIMPDLSGNGRSIMTEMNPYMAYLRLGDPAQGSQEQSINDRVGEGFDFTKVADNDWTGAEVVNDTEHGWGKFLRLDYDVPRITYMYQTDYQGMTAEWKQFYTLMMLGGDSPMELSQRERAFYFPINYFPEYWTDLPDLGNGAPKRMNADIATLSPELAEKAAKWGKKFKLDPEKLKNVVFASGNAAMRKAPKLNEGGAPDMTKAEFFLDWEASPTPTGIDGIQKAKAKIVNVRYINVAGVESAQPWQGANIVVTKYSDGTSTVEKRIIK